MTAAVVTLASCDKSDEVNRVAESLKESRQQKERASIAAKKTATQAENEAEDALSSAKDYLRSLDGIAEAESNLESKVTPGAAQLAASKLDDTKHENAGAKTKFQQAITKLKSAGGNDSAELIKVLVMEGEANIRARQSRLSRHGYSDPEYQALWKRWLHISISIKLDEVMGGDADSSSKNQ